MFKIGDSFVIIKPTIDGLSGCGPFIVKSLEYQTGNNNPGEGEDYSDYVWFEIKEGDTKLRYASKTNIRKATKLELALK